MRKCQSNSCYISNSKNNFILQMFHDIKLFSYNSTHHCVLFLTYTVQYIMHVYNNQAHYIYKKSTEVNPLHVSDGLQPVYNEVLLSWEVLTCTPCGCVSPHDIPLLTFTWLSSMSKILLHHKDYTMRVWDTALCYIEVADGHFAFRLHTETPSYGEQRDAMWL